MTSFFRNDLVQLSISSGHRVNSNKSYDWRLLLEIIQDAYGQTDDPKDKRLFLERGLELTEMDAISLADCALELGYVDLSDAYRSYSSGV